MPCVHPESKKRRKKEENSQPNTPKYEGIRTRCVIPGIGSPRGLRIDEVTNEDIDR